MLSSKDGLLHGKFLGDLLHGFFLWGFDPWIMGSMTIEPVTHSLGFPYLAWPGLGTSA